MVRARVVRSLGNDLTSGIETILKCFWTDYDSGADQCMGFLGARLLSGLRTRGLEDTRALLEGGQGDAAARAVGHLWQLFGSGQKQAELFIKESKREKPSAIVKVCAMHISACETGVCFSRISKGEPTVKG